MFYEGALDEPFYEDLKRRVAAYFRTNGIHPRFAWSMQIKAACIITGVFSFYTIAHFLAPNLLVAYGSAALMGICMALIGTAIQHDANHGAFHPNPRVNFLVGLTIDMIGKSSHIWKQ